MKTLTVSRLFLILVLISSLLVAGCANRLTGESKAGAVKQTVESDGMQDKKNNWKNWPYDSGQTQ